MFWGRRKKEKKDVQNEETTIETQGAPLATDPTTAPPEPEPTEAAGETVGATDDEASRIRDRIVAVLKTVYDPEIPVVIYELGLVYGVEVGDDAHVHVTMTLTSPMCPVAETLPPEVEEKVRNVVGVKDVDLDLVWDPPWSVDMMSDAARLELNLM
ncbi:MAG: SUF system Fe-S cluster assembly protein [bacterium]